MRNRIINIDLNIDSFRILKYKQYDNNNLLQINLKENGEDIILTSYSARAFFQLPSGDIIERNCTINGSKISIFLDNAVLWEYGKVSMEIVISKDDEIVTTFEIILEVEKSIDRNSAIQRDPQWDIIKDQEKYIVNMNNKINEVDIKITEANNKIIEANNKITEVDTTISNKMTQVDSTVSVKMNQVDSQISNKISDVNTTVSNKMTELDNNFDTLEEQLQLDLANNTIVYQNVEGSNISTDSSSGYLKDVEILGNTVQDTSNLADIRSVGDKVEGQELYEIPVLSCGKNLSTLTSCKMNSNPAGADYSLVNCEATTYTISYDLSVSNNTNNYMYLCVAIDKNGNRIISNTISVSAFNNKRAYTTIDIPAKGLYEFRITQNNGDSTGIYSASNIQIEKGTVATPYEPFQSDKLTILSPVQLERVGNVADRIIEKDGVWGVEKNVETVVLDGSETIETYVIGDNYLQANISFDKHLLNSYMGICNRFPNVENINDYDFECFSMHSLKLIVIKIARSRLTSSNKSGFIAWLQDNPTIVEYQLAEPQFIPLPHDQQIKLRTFASKTNISFLTEIEGTIKAQVPKSIGAAVNTHTEQIRSLNHELNRVKKLEESTVSTVTTESDFTTVQETSNGYFEDVKLEGKTLVNIYNHNPSRVVDNQLYGEEVLPRITGETCYAYNLSDKVISMSVYRNNKWAREVALKPLSTVQINLSSEEALHHMVGAFTDGWTSDDKSVFDKSVIVMREKISIEKLHHFEGLKSVGDTTDEIVVSSVNENLFDGKWEEGSIADATGIINTSSNAYRSKNYIRVDSNKTYYYGFDINNAFTSPNIYCYDVNKNFISTIPNNANSKLNKFTVPSNCKYIKVRIFDITNFGSTVVTNAFISENDYYTDYQSDKKRLLYYNEETQTWEKPILREWDSIEKHADGKYYYHQRSGEVVLNGSENWRNFTIETNSKRMNLHLTDAKKSSALVSTVKVIQWTDKPWETTVNTICYAVDYGLYLYLTNVSNEEDFKAWLQANNVTVVHQLVQEKVYECTNIDLITYANETNYIVESGAIVPITTLKVMSNISNVVRTLQRKVSILENDVMQIFKYMLAGDQVSAAYILYPEDFVNTIYNKDTTSIDVTETTDTNNTDELPKDDNGDIIE